MKKSLLFITGIFLICGVFLFVYSLNNRSHGQNGFTRDIRDLQLKMGPVLAFPTSKFHLAGISETQVYLQNLNHPQFGLFSTDYALSALNEIALHLPGDFSVKHRKINMGVINDTTIYVLSSQRAELILINTGTGQRQEFKIPGIYFDRTAFVAKGQMMGRYVQIIKDAMKIDLVRLNYEKAGIDRTYTLKREPEEVFSNDGRLERDPDGSRFFYTYYYRGEFLCLDSNLSLLYKGKTIDTTTASIQLSKSMASTNGKNEIALTQSKPPKTVNRYSCVFQNRFYLCSAKIADYENMQQFNANHVIDVYAADNGTYRYSFYIPKYRGEKMRDFSVRKDCIFVLYRNCMVKYRLDSLPA
ncbi:hypothetical protein HDC92_001814 [Pedobacter sp. AK017]|uniref:hypothetical protein n=1 Tax=Pedobacter sp. AK017 TaxID=2723073 RepID=UPI00160F6866|nr:hypothetical protein [Pedobacter sp. AK017]MBB5438139.1 hypothetical protein [Pedobacter sp. AK017]